jgi:F0F1-type ATP synthase gamma subunit
MANDLLEHDRDLQDVIPQLGIEVGTFNDGFIVLSHAAENEARVRAMISARTNVGKKRDALTARYRQLRQEDVTREPVELASAAQDALGGTG